MPCRGDKDLSSCASSQFSVKMLTDVLLVAVLCSRSGSDALAAQLPFFW